VRALWPLRIIAAQTSQSVADPGDSLERRRDPRIRIPANARFVFGPPTATPTAIPFDTFEAEFGHHGSHSTFETFCDRFAIADPAVRHIGRIVHDLDLKESKFNETETATIGRLVEGLRRAQSADGALLQSGIDMFEPLYQSLKTAEGTKSTAPSRRQTRRSSARGPKRS
jgi:hypothetical protein